MAFRASKKEDKAADDFTGVGAGGFSESTGGSIVGVTMKIKGKLKSEEDVTIAGNVEGKIKVGSTLTIAETGNVSADMEANEVRVFGSAKGKITASHKVELLPSGRYFGNIKSELLVVEEGAILVGDVNKEKEE